MLRRFDDFISLELQRQETFCVALIVLGLCAMLGAPGSCLLQDQFDGGRETCLLFVGSKEIAEPKACEARVALRI